MLGWKSNEQGNMKADARPWMVVVVVVGIVICSPPTTAARHRDANIRDKVVD